MNKYKELRDRQQSEVNALPLGFAFSNRQFDEMMRGWGLDPEKDLDKIVSIGAGGFIQKKDRSLMHETFDRHERELKEAIAADETGEGFIFDMFLCELDNHEYGYTGDTSEALEALGFTAQEVVDDPRLNRGTHRDRTHGRKAPVERRVPKCTLFDEWLPGGYQKCEKCLEATRGGKERLP